MRGYGHRVQVLDRGHLGTPAWAKRVDFTWDQNTEADIATYTLYAGRTTGNYTEPTKDMGNNTCGSYTIAVQGAWFFALTATNVDDLESDFSDEVSGTFS